jgi:hypothetical protein
MATQKSNKIGLHIEIQDSKANDIQSPNRLSVLKTSNESLLVFTKAVAKPSIQDTIKTNRFQLRFFQVFIGICTLN